MTTPRSQSSFDHYETPWPVVRMAERLFRVEFQLDPCATRLNKKAPTWFSASNDGLAQPWGTAACFVNPPYGRALPLWVARCRGAAYLGAHVVALIPPGVATKWWSQHVVHAANRVVFLTGRIAFWLDGAPTNKKWVDSCLVEWRPGGSASGHNGDGLEVEWANCPGDAA